jgi:cysteinyl-tRNA synthetase
MPLVVFNSLGRKKEEFRPLKDREVGLYSCGPTVYDLPHIGNYRSFFMADLVRRWLEHRGFRVRHVMNITDIDDKTIRDSAKAGMSLQEFTRKYEKVFLEGLDSLNIRRAHAYPRATEHVKEMIELNKRLQANGLAYPRDDGLYYDIRKFKNYGKLSGVSLEGLKAGARVSQDEYSKENPQDFALWKKSSPEELERSKSDPNIAFETPWGVGRPGWHVECSAMSMKHLGESFDVHTGGVDLLFPHHENEIAQSEGATGKPFVKYWLHGEHLIVNGQKMSKSLGNYFTLTDLLNKFDYNQIRYLFLMTHYRDKLNYTEENMALAVRNSDKLKIALENLDFFISKAGAAAHKADSELLASIEKRRAEFEAAMDDDFNSPKALMVLHEITHDIYKYLNAGGRNKKVLESARAGLLGLLNVFGLFERPWKPAQVSKEVESLIKEREKSRAAKDFKKADEIRAMLKEKGIWLDDFPEGTRWRPV